MESFDRDTLSVAGIGGSVASYRLEVLSKLKGRIESAIRDLFATQTDILSAYYTVKKFIASLLHKARDNEGTEQFYNDNAAAVRSAEFAFDSAMSDLQVPSLSLTKDEVSQEMSTQLNIDQLSFPYSPATRLKLMKSVNRAVNKQKQPSEKECGYWT